jgi:uncharacterized membrane-anchored protein
VIHFKGFLLEVIDIFKVESESWMFEYYRKGYEFGWLAPKWGMAMVIASIIALLTSWRRSDNATIILLV